MKQLPKLLLAAGAVVFVIAIVLSIIPKFIIASPGGWLELSLVLAVFSAACKYVLEEGAK
jgi:hypothetical protein